MIGSVLGCYWVGVLVVLAKAAGRTFDAPPSMQVIAVLLGGCFGWTSGWLLTAFLRRKRMGTRRDRVQFWAFGMLPAMLTAIIAMIVIVSWIEDL
jgi:hypothetical protein